MKGRLIVYLLLLCLTLVISCKSQEKGLEPRALSNEDVSIQNNVREALVPIDDPDISVLIERLNDEDVQVRHRSVLALSKIGMPAHDAVPAVGTRLNDVDKNEEVRQSALKVLRAIGTVGAMMEIMKYRFHKPQWIHPLERPDYGHWGKGKILADV